MFVDLAFVTLYILRYYNTYPLLFFSDMPACFEISAKDQEVQKTVSYKTERTGDVST